MRTLFNPARCCCHDVPPCDVNPKICFGIASECCVVGEGATLDVTHDGDDVGTLTWSGGPQVCLELDPTWIGDTLDWTATIPGFPDQTGTRIVPDCGQSVTVNPYYTIPEVVPSVLHATVNGPPGIVGGGGVWSGTLTYIGFTPFGGLGGGGTYQWQATPTTGAYGRSWNTPRWRCLIKNRLNSCGQPYGGVSGVDKPVVTSFQSWSRTKKILWDYSEITFSIRVSDPGTPCVAGLSWNNKSADPSTLLQDFCGDERDCPCGYWDEDEIAYMAGHPGSWIPPHATLPADEIIPIHMFPTDRFYGGTSDTMGAWSDLCVLDWSGTFTDFPNCYPTNGTWNVTL